MGSRTVDSMLVGFGKGKLTYFLGDPDSIIDVVSSLKFFFNSSEG